MARDTLIDFFHDFSLTRGDFLVYDDGFRSRSYSYEETTRRAKHLLSASMISVFARGDAVVFWSENRPEWIAAFWGCLLRGVVVVPVDFRSSQDFLPRVRGSSRRKLVLVGQEVSPPRESPRRPDLELHELEWPDGEPTGTRPNRYRSATRPRRSSSRRARPRSLKASSSRTATSSRTSSRSNAKCSSTGSGATPFSPIRFLNLLPLSHMFGQAMATFVPPMLGGVVVFMRGYNPVDIVAQVK